VSLRVHNSVLLGGLLAALAVAASLALTLEPVDGDLTRVGGLSEARWGWRGEHVRFSERLHRYPVDGGERPPAEILVLGDSFSHQSHRGYEWQALLAEKTGLAIVTFDLHRFQPEHILTSAAYRRHPPATVIYESSELSLADRLNRLAGACRPGAGVEPPGLPVQPVRAAHISVTRPTSYGWDLSGRMNAATHVMRMAVKTLVGTRPVRVLPLDRRGLFSSRAQDLLTYGYAVRERPPTAQIERMACGLADLSRQVETTLGAAFVPLLVPTKYASYAPFLKKGRGEKPGVTSAVLAASGVPGPDLAPALQGAIAAGIRDVYLPNDSHWGPEGHRIAADAVYRFLLQQGMIVDMNPGTAPVTR